MHLATCTCTCTCNISFNSSHCTTAHVRTEYIHVHVDLDDYLKSFNLVSVKFDENLSCSFQNFLLLIARL